MLAHLREAPPACRQPAEWEPHAATWAGWPFGVDGWRGHLETARDEYARFVETLAGFEPVRLLVADDETEADARRRLANTANVEMLRVPLDDVWLRDSGPIFFAREDGTISFVHFGFNAWGGKFEWRLDDEVPEALAARLDLDHHDADLVLEGGSLDTNGEGDFLTTRQCLLEPARNPHLDEAALTAALREWLGARRVVWLDGGLEGDHTDGHVDTIARFVDRRTVVACVSDDPSDRNHAVLEDNLRVLRAAGYEVVTLPLPSDRREVEGERLPMTYANFYIVNGGVIVPQYGDRNDARALDILRPLFPGRRVVGLPSSSIITGGGSFHCLTQQQPAGPLWRGARA